jgi:hypothetical protein
MKQGFTCLHAMKRRRTGAMIPLKERFIVDENGQRVGVLLDIEDYRQLLKDLEELEAIRAYDAAKVSGDEAVLLEQALAESELRRRTTSQGAQEDNTL